MFAPSPSSMSPFLHDRIVLRPMNTPLADADAAVDLALRVEQAVVVDDDVVADVNLVRMPQHDVLAEDDVAAARSEQQRIQRLPQRQAERAGAAPARAMTTSSYFSSAAETRAADDQRRRTSRGSTCPARTAAPAPSIGAVAAGQVRSSEPAMLAVPVQRAADALAQPDAAARSRSRVRARVMSKARLFVKKSTRRR